MSFLGLFSTSLAARQREATFPDAVAFLLVPTYASNTLKLLLVKEVRQEKAWSYAAQFGGEAELRQGLELIDDARTLARLTLPTQPLALHFSRWARIMWFAG